MVRQRDARRRRVEIVKGLTDNIRDDVRAPAACWRLLLDGDQYVGATHAVADRRHVQRSQHLDVDDFRLDALEGQSVGRGESLADHGEAGDNRRMTAGSQHPRAARHRHLIDADRRCSLHREERLVLEDEDWIVVADRSLEHQIGLLRI